MTTMNGIPCAVAALLTATLWVGGARAADQAKKDRCTRYAQRAVEQYNLMQSHPQCQVSDDLNWHGNLDGHYNGCMLIPEIMSRAGEAGRDNHLQACGAFTTASSQPPPPTAAAGAATSAPSTSADPGTVAGGTGAPQRVAVPNVQTNCEQHPPASLQRGSYAGSGANPQLHGDTLSFNDGRKNGALRSFNVQRPAYFVTFQHCVNSAAYQMIGPWVWVADGGREANFFSVNYGQVMIWTLSPSVAADLLKN